MDFLAEQKLIFTSQKYENIYRFLKDKLNLKYHETFVLCAAIGYKNNRARELDKKGREFRSNFLSTGQKVTIYSIILNDQEIGKQIEKFNDKDFQLTAKKKIEQYAEGGMEILCEDVFGNKVNEFMLDENYDEYEVDILSYIYQEATEIPF